MFLDNNKNTPEVNTKIEDAIKHFNAPNLSNKEPPNTLPSNEQIANIEPVIPTVAASNFNSPWK